MCLGVLTTGHPIAFCIRTGKEHTDILMWRPVYLHFSPKISDRKLTLPDVPRKAVDLCSNFPAEISQDKTTYNHVYQSVDADLNYNSGKPGRLTKTCHLPISCGDIACTSDELDGHQLALLSTHKCRKLLESLIWKLQKWSETYGAMK